MKRKLLLGCLLPLVIVGLIAWFGMKSLMRAEPTPSRFDTVSRGDVEIKVTETGTIEALKKVEIKSKVGGRIAKLYVQEGDRVRAGQVLADIDPTEINSQVEQMRAQLDAAKARLEQSSRGVTYQKVQTVAGVEQYDQALRAAETRLKIARQENATQPHLSASDISQAEATQKSAEDNLTLLKNATHPQALVAAETGLEEMKAAAANAKRNYVRQKSLFEREFVAEQAVDNARADLAAANARRDQAQKRMDLIAEQNRLEIANAESRVKEARAAMDRARANQSVIGIKTDEVASAIAAVKQARAQLVLAKRGDEQDRMREDDVRAARAGVVQIENQLREVQVRQGDTRLVASMDGVVTRRYIEAGELVTSGVGSFSNGTPVLQIADLSKMLVKMSVNEVDVHKIRVGLPVELTIDGARGVVFNGQVSKVAPAAIGSGAPGQEGQQQRGGGEGGVIRFAVEVLVDRPDIRLKPGMTAKCTIVIARRKGVLRLPSGDVSGEGSSAKVEILTQTMKEGKPVDTATPRPVTAGLRGDSHVEVITGLKEGEKVKPGAYTGPPRKAIDINID